MNKKQFVSKAVKNKLFNTAKGDYLLSLPEIDTSYAGAVWENTKEDLVVLNDLPFSKFTTYSCVSDAHRLLSLEVNSLQDITLSAYLNVSDKDFLEIKTTLALDLEKQAFKLSKLDVWSNNTPLDPSASKIVEDLASAFITDTFKALAKLLTYASENRLTPMLSVPLAKKSKGAGGKKKAAAKVTDIQLVYRDTLPSKAVTIGNGSSKSGHARRAHRRTLSHPCFMNHPLYGIKDAIRIKDTWIGPKEENYMGRKYTVL